MANVQPLRGIRYNSEKAGDLSSLVTPPYDVISGGAQEGYYAQSPYNVIRLELGQEHAEDTSLNNRYTRAATTFSEWRLDGVLQQETLPSYYLYQQRFTYDNQSYTRTSLLARVWLEPWNKRVVLPHEHTLAKARNDRLQLLRACATNLSPVMCLYDDPQGRIRRLLGRYAAQAEVQITDEVNEGHVLQPIADEQVVASIVDFFLQRQLYIADGHHRYETALQYRDEIRNQRHELLDADAANFVLMALIDLDDPGLLVLPTHRLLFNLKPEALQNVTSENLARYFTVKTLGATESSDALLAQLAVEADSSRPALVLSVAGQNWLLSINEQGQQRMHESGHSAAWNNLDVAVAHTLIIEDILGLNAQDMTAGTNIRYMRDADPTLQAVQTGEAQAAILLNATRVRQMCDVADASDLMPQKSTYFYPKLITGLVMNPLW
ncbi:MAG TPA: DUF1015 domain-containing protein [Ktedonobacteraceae bacterium]|nr:DUF1015 domain-containing protein [Ktedonobacteraceae bacterium]